MDLELKEKRNEGRKGEKEEGGKGVEKNKEKEQDVKWQLLFGHPQEIGTGKACSELDSA